MIKQLNNISETVEPLACWLCDGGKLDYENCCLCDGGQNDWNLLNK